MFMHFEFKLGCKVNSVSSVLSLMPSSPVSSISFVIHPMLPRDSQEAGNRSSLNKREEGKESERDGERKGMQLVTQYVTPAIEVG